ncbi:MAG: aminotransferase class IV [Alphaproteobacteria bacterium]
MPSDAAVTPAVATPAGAPDLSAGVAFVDGKYVPILEARISLLDWGFLKSDVTYDVVHVWKGLFFRLDDHLDRFERSVAGLRMTLPYSRVEIADILNECVRRARLHDAYVQVACTRGIPPSGVRDPRQCCNRFYAFAIPFVWIASEAQRARGVHLVVSSVQRIPPGAVDPTIKNFHWGDFTRALFEAYERGGELPVLLGADGNVTEGPGYNIFAVHAGRVTTPERGVLLGITRRTVIELCDELNVTAEVRPLSAPALQAAAEVFLSSTAGGIMPVAKIDGRPVGDGAPGLVTTRLHDLYWSKKEAGWHGTPVFYD